MSDSPLVPAIFLSPPTQSPRDAMEPSLFASHTVEATVGPPQGTIPLREDSLMSAPVPPSPGTMVMFTPPSRGRMTFVLATSRTELFRGDIPVLYFTTHEGFPMAYPFTRSLFGTV